MSVTIFSVDHDSPAEHAGILPGETLCSINGNEICDILDYRFYETEKEVLLLLRDAQGAAREIKLRKGQYESIGLQFETYLMDRQRSCWNKCVFCFIDQLPSGMRESLYFKDDDSRLSFLFGNYITLTNLSQREADRIIKMKISPINISVHTTNPELRCRMMGNRFAGDCLRYLYQFAEAGIKLNCQLVLCHGWNDGEELERTLRDLLPLYPSVQSIALVPLGVTKFREGLTPLTPYTAETALEVVRTAERWGEQMQKQHGERICYAADEFYLKAGLPIPDAAFYGAFDQLENGVGLIANFREEFLFALEDVSSDAETHSGTLVTGVSFAPFLEELLDGLRRKCHNLTCKVAAIRNDFFGESINVAGLVTGGDILKQLQGKELGGRLLVPDTMLRHEGDLFLDNVSLKDLERELGVPVSVVPDDGGELLKLILRE
ncbi:DUF512 domain-containing protein [Anaeromassilibacillus sp. An200]|uniref:DUF512 domain-containing protein n=1 Tax=Anaeromassilibacillus sp. An200 TaxID=1965587 RepID=UPI000B39C017|nr:DUF512 domain-containing protein [Anaeromassilibacillus sp. An200]OUP10768.1 Fe/S oxidoreductase [Anaeromassilibacillus sp. An200]